MNELLTLDEASRYLKVSKSSLRRWTNQGRLPCVRVGERGERRFRRSDIERLVAASPAADTPPIPDEPHPLRALESAAARGVPRHVSLHHHDREELWRLFRGYVVDHLRRDAPILYIHEAGAREDILARVRGEGWDPDELIARGGLRLLVPAEAYLRTGSFHPDRMIDFMESAILDFRALGKQTVLLSGEMTWYLSGAQGVEGMIPYEARLNDLLGRYPDVTIVCHYDIGRLPGEITLGALCSHPHAHLPERLFPGYYRGRGARAVNEPA